MRGILPIASGLLLLCGCEPGSTKRGTAGAAVSAVPAVAPRTAVEGPLPTGGNLPTSLRGRYRAFYCGSTGFVDAGSTVDGPSYYFERQSGRVISICGGACMGDMDRCRRECPPSTWTCGPVPAEAFVPIGRS